MSTVLNDDPDKIMEDSKESAFGKVVVVLLLASLIIGAIWMWMGSSESDIQVISGKVVNRDNSPVQGVRVVFLDDFVVTNSNGLFSFVFQKKDSSGELYVQHPNYDKLITQDVQMDMGASINMVVVFDDTSARNEEDKKLPNIETALSEENPFNSEMIGFESPTSNYSVWVDLDWGSFINKNKEQVSNNYRLEDIEVYFVGDNKFVATLWYRDNEQHRIWTSDDMDDLLTRDEQFSEKGFQPIDMEIFTENGERRLIGIWRSGINEGQQHKILMGLNWKEFLQKWEELGKENFRLIDLEAYSSSKGIKYSGIWHTGKGEFRLWKANTLKQFLKKRKEYIEEKLLLIDMEIFLEEGEKRYIGAWGSGELPDKVWIEANWSQFNAKRKEFDQEKRRLIDLEIENIKRENKLSGVWVR